LFPVVPPQIQYVFINAPPSLPRRVSPPPFCNLFSQGVRPRPTDTFEVLSFLTLLLSSRDKSGIWGNGFIRSSLSWVPFFWSAMSECPCFLFLFPAPRDRQFLSPAVPKDIPASRSWHQGCTPYDSLQTSTDSLPINPEALVLTFPPITPLFLPPPLFPGVSVENELNTLFRTVVDP